MWTYLVVFIKIIFTQFCYFSSTYNFTMSSVHDPIHIISPLFFGISFAFCDLGLNANLHLFLIHAIIFIIYALWFIAAVCLIIGIASKKSKKIGFVLSFILLLIECISCLFIQITDTKVYYLAVNICFLALTAIPLFKTKE